MTKALEAIEQKKAEKTWSYTQLKKPRFAHIKKAHWDYVLDEMVCDLEETGLYHDTTDFQYHSSLGFRLIFVKKDGGRSLLLINCLIKW